MFGWFKKKAMAKGPTDPLAAYDELIGSLDRQGQAVRKSAATLLALRKELSRDLERYGERLQGLPARLAKAQGDPAAEKTLTRDREEAERLLDATKQALARADADSALLVETAEQLGRRRTELLTERQSARARLGAGVAVSDALKQQAERFDKIVALDAARDEVERAHALAEIYRTEGKD